MLKKNSKRQAKSHPYIVCSDYKERGCYPQNMNYDKFESHILYVIKKICQIYADKEIFYSVYEKYQNIIKKSEIIPEKLVADCKMIEEIL